MFREDIVWNTFHTLLHVTSRAINATKFQRKMELFFYGHGQMVRKGLFFFLCKY